MADDAGFSRAPRLFLTAFLLAYLVFAYGNGMDRLSANSPSLERLVPGPFRAQADRSAAGSALARGNSELALRQAEQATGSDPFDAASLALLGSGRLEAGDRRGAEAAFRIAAQLGWRERTTQLYWFDRAIGLGDFELAALRADALMRAEPPLVELGLLLEPLEAEPAGRLALAHRLADSPAWQERYFMLPQDARPTLLLRRTEVAMSYSEEGGSLGCDTPAGLATALLQNGFRSEAERIWLAHCSTAEIESPIADPAFATLALADQSSPFGWTRHSRGDLRITVAADDAGQTMLRASNSASVSRLLVSQAVALEPGRYRLTVDAGSEAVGRLAATLDCGSSTRRPERVDGDPAGSGQVLVMEECGQQVLGLWLRPGSGEVTISRVAMEPIE